MLNFALNFFEKLLKQQRIKHIWLNFKNVNTGKIQQEGFLIMKWWILNTPRKSKIDELNHEI